MGIREVMDLAMQDRDLFVALEEELATGVPKGAARRLYEFIQTKLGRMPNVAEGEYAIADVTLRVAEKYMAAKAN